MWKLVEVINQKEIRNLLIANSWPEEYFDEELDNIAESIFKEFEDLRSSETLEDKDMKINQKARLSILKSVFRLFSINPEEAKRVIKSCGLEYKTKEEVKRAINQREFDIQVKKLQKKNLNNAVKTKERTFEEIMTPIILHLHLSFASVRDITAAEFCALEKQYLKSA